MACVGSSGVRGVGVERLVGVLRELRQGPAHALAHVRDAAEGADVRVRPAARRQGDVRRRAARMRVSTSRRAY